ncbi:metal ABC transporter permease [Tissierella praeacuta]|uniref:metal ABC transporter permease n=1 Tax=Tissierella praeacuta TaxID=43131 RepID=UPI001C109353|nr:metal ABC transporter permease [Tissierella praeacuta]MBU5256294.1 metal ABC transporter permease [Tissierella praeacuta]
MENIIFIIKDAFHYDFMIKAIVAGVLIAISSSFLGIFIVLRKHSMIGDGLAHVSFATVAIALLLKQSPILISIPIVVLASVLILKLSEIDNLNGDASIGLISSFSVAVGILISSLSKGSNIDLFSYLFGSILVISDFELILSVILSIIILSIIILFYNSLFAITYDESFATTMGINVKKLNYLISILTGITVVLGIRIVGTMLISSMIIFPTVTALQISTSFKNTIIISEIISILSVIVGLFISFVYDLPTGATIVIVNAICFMISLFIKKIDLS